MRPLLIGLLVLLAPPTPERRALREIEANYRAMERGFATGDTLAILSYRTPEFSAELPNGERQGPEEMARMLGGFFRLNHPPITARTTIRDADFVSPDTVRLTVFQKASRYQDLAGRRRRVDHDVTQRETWVRTPAGWRIHFVDQVRDPHRWVDGKPIEPGKPYDPNAPLYKPPKKK